MKILALIGSPRKKGNTDLLVEQILEGAKTKGHATEKLYLYDYTISLCVDCRNCKKGDYVCCVNDEMQQIYPLMEGADVIVFGTPIYWYGPTAKMKMLLDRMRPFVENKKLRGKRAVVVVPSAEGPKACDPTIEMFRLSFEYLGVEFAGKVLAKAFDKGAVSKHPEKLKEAFLLGCSL
ncbi:flavodoxin family protein [Candidatus Bathyarchaeota archaeon]|nr:flavodoxin family protein [Candidatus Bathyarchaeota archaeon]